MGTTAQAGGGTTQYAPAPAGNHLAICVGVIDLGTQESTYQGETKWKHKIMLQWELCDEKREDDKPFTLSRDFGLSLHENSKLRPFLKAWRGRDFTEEELANFDVQNLLGVPCMLNVVHEKSYKDPTRVYANVTSAVPLPKRVTAPDPVGDLIYYDADTGLPPESLPKWLREKILKAREFASLRQDPTTSPEQSPGADPMPGNVEWDDRF